MKLNLIVINKLKNSSLEALEKNYLKKLTRIDLSIFELKSSKSTLENSLQILALIRKKSIRPYIILLDEKGKEMTTLGLKSYLSDLNLKYPQHDIFFTIGDSNGYDQKIYEKADATISLSKFTFTHKLARIIFIEQLYRVDSLNKNHPYHRE